MIEQEWAVYFQNFTHKTNISLKRKNIWFSFLNYQKSESVETYN